MPSLNISTIAIISAGGVVLLMLAYTILQRIFRPTSPPPTFTPRLGRYTHSKELVQEKPTLVDVCLNTKWWGDGDGEGWGKVMPLSVRMDTPIPSSISPPSPHSASVPPPPGSTAARHVVEITVPITMPSPHYHDKLDGWTGGGQEYALGLTQVPFQG